MALPFLQPYTVCFISPTLPPTEEYCLTSMVTLFSLQQAPWEKPGQTRLRRAH